MTLERRPRAMQASLKIEKRRQTALCFDFNKGASELHSLLWAKGNTHCLAIKRRSREVSISPSHSRGPEFQFQPRNKSSTLTSFIAFLSHWCRYWNSTLQCAMAPFFDVIFNSPFKTSPFIWCYITHVTEKASYPGSSFESQPWDWPPWRWFFVTFIDLAYPRPLSSTPFVVKPTIFTVYAT
jgi:hypothetical protein